jgi:tRNA nucleotidyltransferase (CCA-adding enzyme)
MRQAFSREEMFRKFPAAASALLEAVAEEATRRKSDLYLVGGPVRDLLLEREIRDLDVLLVPRKPRRNAALEVARAVAPQGAKLVEYSRFGTAGIEAANWSLDIATARRESYERPGALPVVEASGLDDDLRRRDFSVNALAISLQRTSGDAPLDVVDVCGGMDDLRGGVLRVLHDRSFHDDPTRILRAARLAPRLGFRLARGTRSLLRDALRDGVLGSVSGDRLRRELERFFSDARLGLDPAVALRRLNEWHVLGAVEPGLSLPPEVIGGIRRLGRGIAQPAWRVTRFRPWVPGLSLWLAPQAPALRRRVLRRFSVRGETAERVASFPTRRDRALGRLARTRGRGAVDRSLGQHDEEDILAFFASADTAARRKILRWAAEDRGRRAPLSGSELLELGLSGPALGRVLERIRSAHLDGEIANREEALALAQELMRRQRGAKTRKKANP